jgi:hypothetical protein
MCSFFLPLGKIFPTCASLPDKMLKFIRKDAELMDIGLDTFSLLFIFFGPPDNSVTVIANPGGFSNQFSQKLKRLIDWVSSF